MPGETALHRLANLRRICLHRLVRLYERLGALNPRLRFLRTMRFRAGLLAGFVLLNASLVALGHESGAVSPMTSASNNVLNGLVNLLSEESSTRSQVTLEIRESSSFVWPAEGNLTSYFGAYHTTGIDIGLGYGVDSPVRAARAGTVQFAGGNTCCQYGRYVIIDHGDGFTTLYGHLSRLSVSTGEQVAQGQLLGLGGDTGEADGKHLHFEMLQGGRYVDPLRYLPAAQSITPTGEPRPWLCLSETLRVEVASQVTLQITEARYADYKIENAYVTTGAKNPPAINVAATDALQLQLTVETAPTLTGQSSDYELHIDLANPLDEKINLVCGLTLKTNRTGYNTPTQKKRDFDVGLNTTPPAAPVEPTATPAPKATKTATPTKTPTPVKTATPSPPFKLPTEVPTATPSPAPPANTPTPTKTPTPTPQP